MFITSILKCCCCSIAQLYLPLCSPMDCTTPGFPMLHYLPKSAQTLVHRVGGAIQPFCSLLCPSPPAFSLSHHQGLFKWVSSSHQVAKVLELQLQHQSSNEYSGLVSFIHWFDLLAVQGTLNSLLQPQFKSIGSSALCFLYSPTLTSIHDY